jgi:hypothetical protein
VDRELLAMEAERRGYLGDPAVQRRLRDREYELLLGEIYRRVLVPGLEPTPSQLDSLRATGLYRNLDLDYILVAPAFLEDARQLAERLRQGARFDSAARMWSQHPSKANGGHYGWILARDLDPRSYAALRTVEPGAVLGPYVGTIGHQIYRVRGLQELTPDSLYRFVKEERARGILRNYQASLLEKYHFALDTTQVNTVLFLAATEPVVQILTTLGPDGTRPAAPGRRALGAIARVDGDSLTFPDLVLADRRTWGEGQKLTFRNRTHLMDRCGAALIPALVLRDALERGIAQDPDVARTLRLLREEEATRAMAARESGGPPDSAALRAYYTENNARYRRPEAVRARAVCFDADSAGPADAALRSWLVSGAADAAIAAHGFEPQVRASSTTLWPRHFGEITVLASDSDPVAVALRTLAPGRLTAAVPSVQGILVAEVLEREAPRPLTYAEAEPVIRHDAAAAREDRWIGTVLPRLRAATKIRIDTARLTRMKLAPEGAEKGSR